ncbi:MAG TPA: DUF2207 domain-containing protein [Lysobacter sp.]|nr:DUF2207 domain-containing protein [Lysobacter sp.]
MRRLPALVIALVALLLAAAPVFAEEQILSYDSDIDIHADGSLDVTERITVRAEGDQIRRGIYRDFPTRYKDRFGNRVVVDFKVLGVQRDGRSEPWFTENVANGVRVNTGNDDFLPVPAQYTYTLRYRTTRQLGFFADHDELYWNAIGTGWAFPIMSGTVEARLPQAVPVKDMHVEGYTGAQGAKGNAYSAGIPQPGVARWQLTQPLAAQEGFTVVLIFPKGLIAAPTRAQKILRFFKDNRGALVALLGLFGLIAYCMRRWRQVGRDPRAGIVITRYEPPAGHTPAGLRYMRRMQYDPRCFSADLLELAVGGHVRIHRKTGLFADKWWLERVTGVTMDGASEGQRALLTRLFASAPKLELEDDNAVTIAGARAEHLKALVKQFQPALFNRFGGSILIAIFIAVASLALAGMVSGGAGMLAIVAVGAVMLITVVVFTVVIKAPTKEGRKLLDEIEGLKLYLGVAEREDLARLPGPDAPPVLDAARYERLLPYAVALEVEDAWTRQFTLAVGVAAAAATTSAISWYRGGGADDLASLTRSVGNSLSSQIASSSSPPGSSSGSGGGGSSGGGGGGGGGGGR